MLKNELLEIGFKEYRFENINESFLCYFLTKFIVLEWCESEPHYLWYIEQDDIGRIVNKCTIPTLDDATNMIISAVEIERKRKIEKLAKNVKKLIDEVTR